MKAKNMDLKIPLCVGPPRVYCTVCGKVKAPRGRSVPLEACGSDCDWECPGYSKDPKPSHLWPGETCESMPWCAWHGTHRKEGGKTVRLEITKWIADKKGLGE